MRDILFARFIFLAGIGPLELLGLSRDVTCLVIGRELDRKRGIIVVVDKREGRNDDESGRHFIKSDDIVITSSY